MEVYILRDDVCMKFSCCRMPYCVLVTGFVLGLLVILLLGSASALVNPVGPSAGGNRCPLTTPSPDRGGNACYNPPSQPDMRREPHVVVTGRERMEGAAAYGERKISTDRTATSPPQQPHMHQSAGVMVVGH